MSLVSLTVLIGILAAVALSPMVTKAGAEYPLLHRPDKTQNDQQK